MAKGEQATIQEALRQIEQVKKLSTFDNEDTVNAFTYLSSTYSQYPSPEFRKKLGDQLANTGFAELAMKFKKWVNMTGAFRDDVVWAVAYSFMTSIWCFSDASLLLCQRLIEADFMRFVVADLKHPPYLEGMTTSQNIGYIILASVSILHNVAKVHELREKFYELGTVDALQPLLQCSDDSLKAIATMAIAHVIKEEENDKIMAGADVLLQLTQLLESALESSDHRYSGFTAEELTDALGLLAVNDANKKKIMDANAMPSFKKMIGEHNPQEQAVALKAISNLSFDAEVRATFQKDSELMTQLQNLSKCKDEPLKRLAASALWVINEKSEEKKKEAEKKDDEGKAPAKKGHVMISYNWGNQPMLLKVRDALQKAGCTVWMDVDDISGSTLQAMAEAVEGASLVLMCMSEKYKNSPNCRIEAEYAYQRQKPILPLLMQRGYKPDGWLGIILGSKLFVEFSDKYPFDKSATNLVQQVKHMLAESTGEKPSAHSSESSAPAKVQSSQLYVKWTADEVQKWLKESGFEKCKDKFKNVDGKSLDQLHEIKRSAPEFFFRTVKDDLCLQFGEILRFSDAMNNLP